MRARSLSVLVAALLASAGALAQAPSTQQPFARDLYKELIEIDTTTATGDTARAADAMAERLLEAGFSKDDVKVFKPSPRKGNLIARLRGTGARRPIMLVAHLDVVDARREDWSTDPFKLVEKDGYLYGRGTQDDKFLAASFVTTLIRFKREGFRPDRDLVLVLETDEEIFDRNALGMQWLLEHERASFDFEYALNEGGAVGGVNGQPVMVAVQVAEKVPANYVIEARNRGGHSSQPRKDNAIYELARALAKLSDFEFPIVLSDTTRQMLGGAPALYPPNVAVDLKAIAGGSDDAATLARLSKDPVLNAILRTTCVATVLDGPGAYNALPQQVRATVNCRILPGQSPADVLATLRKVVADDKVSVTQEWAHVSSPPSAINEELMKAIAKASAETWRPVPIFPILSPGASDSFFLRNAGIPSYGIAGAVADLGDAREHGRDERIHVKSFVDGHDFVYRLLKNLSSSAPTGQDR